MHKNTPDDIRRTIERLLPQTQEFLCTLIRYPSTPGQEQDAIDYTATAFANIGAHVESVPIQNSIREDEDYSTPIPDLTYDGHRNLRVVRKGFGGGKTLLLNTHLDVVPASENQEDAFHPTVTDGVIRGRGACDAKGQAATLFLVLSALETLGVSLDGDIILHLVVEEEVGGNGTLAMIRRGEKADGAIILEPTDLNVLPSVRGAVWFRITFEGRTGHSGSGGTISALNMARQVMNSLDDYHAKLLAASRGIPLFDKFADPMPLTFGTLSAGKWPSAAPNHAVLEGVLGFLPNKTRFQIMDEIRAAVANTGDEWLRDHTRVEFMYRHDAHVLDPHHPLVQNLYAQCLAENVKSEISAMTASCDSWFYNNQLGLPTVVFGPGSLGYAHSSEEQISPDQIAAAARVLIRFIRNWCGTAAF
ncbi:MAG TPA: M20/M25/M40 family metallo-hydrolase [bacterium]|nr:M20/M25/M40 family metallo-hydrolase [bacterium]HQL61547.1 M20/M25/M40 family metallo-hydrolase [bacterium]